jgi:hypothetical protein
LPGFVRPRRQLYPRNPQVEKQWLVGQHLFWAEPRRCRGAAADPDDDEDDEEDDAEEDDDRERAVIREPDED